MYEHEHKPEVRVDSLETLGLCLRDSMELELSAMPLRVEVDRESHFFRSAYDRVFSGQTNIGIDGMFERKHRGIEHAALVGCNDLGELLISKKVFEGDRRQALTPRSYQELQELQNNLRILGLPPGWRTLGMIHSHPEVDMVNHAVISTLRRIPHFGSITDTSSGGDFDYFLDEVRNGERQVSMTITPTQLSIMAATRRTIELMRRPRDIYEIIMDSTSKLPKPMQTLKEWKYKTLLDRDFDSKRYFVAASLLLPPYQVYEELGIVHYVGNHWELNSGKFMLEKQ